MNTDIDKARELSDAREIDALSDAPDVPFVLVDRPEPYTMATWHIDCADFMVSDKPEHNEEIRLELQKALYWYATFAWQGKPESNLWRSNGLMLAANSIGIRVIQNAIANGLTAEKVGG